MEVFQPASAHLAEDDDGGNEEAEDGPVADFLLVSILGARGLVAVNRDGTSNPYAVLRYNRTEKKTPVCSDTVDPRWSSHFIYPMPSAVAEQSTGAAGAALTSSIPTIPEGTEDDGAGASAPPPTASVGEGCGSDNGGGGGGSGSGSRELLLMLFSFEAVMSDDLIGKVEIQLPENLPMNKPFAFEKWYQVQPSARAEQDRLQFRRKSHLRAVSRALNPKAWVEEKPLGGQGEVLLSIVPLALAQVPGLLDSLPRTRRHLSLYMAATNRIIADLEAALQRTSPFVSPPMSPGGRGIADGDLPPL
ncbi:unnamed protein product, partial [Phaeothamnion confervicola]